MMDHASSPGDLSMRPEAGAPVSPAPAEEWRWLPRLRAAAIGALAGLAAGLVVGGVGGRLAMRLVVLSVARFPTQSAEGTLFIVLLGGVVGATLGLLYMALRRWLPGGPRANGLIYGLILLAVPGVAFFIDGLFHADSELREGPLALGVGLFSALIVGYGLALAQMVTLLDRRLPAASRRRPGALLGYGAATLLGLACAALGGTLLVLLVASAVSLLITGQAIRLPSF
jgi:hypothetical protein